MITDFSNILTQHQDVDGYSFYNLLQTIHIDINDPSAFTEIQYDGSTLVDVAHKHYNDVNLWWLVAAANGIKNPFGEVENRTLKILKRPLVNQILNQINK